MIASKDRSGWFGASDVGYIIGNYSTKSFTSWWLEKLAYSKNDFTNDAMLAGTHYEHKILDFIKAPEKDKQIKIPELLLRVNLDGNSDDTIFEVKTYRYEKGFKVPIKYKWQVWVQLYASQLKKAYIVAYGLIDSDYKNFFNNIDKERLDMYEIEPNQKWIDDTFLPCLRYLVHCYHSGMFPTNEGRELWTSLNVA
jgi:hypothetical protein